MIKNTGIKVTPEHLEIVLSRAQGIVSTPIIKVQGQWLTDEARMAFGDWIDALAQEYGLPAPKRDSDGDTIHYGMTGEGEFQFWDADPDLCAPQDILGT